ncbi:MAG: alkaline phosphatase D family protein [Bdellovibrionaceae bacterium]|nr:alkaline phosphatase D family protein [Pseudobdellovibrionaceae bacterium]
MKLILWILASSVLLSLSCAQTQLKGYMDANSELRRVPNANTSADPSIALGRFAVIQGPTSSAEANFSLISPRYKDYTYILVDSSGREITRVSPYEVVSQANYSFWKIDKFHFANLNPNTEYGFHVVEKKADEIKNSIDFRTFKTFDKNMTRARFVVGSCSADDERFASVRKSIWSRVVEHNPDFIIMNGDVVYVDSFEFVKREDKIHKIQEWEIWGRYMDSFRTLEIFRSKKLFPIIANWDDHDMGTNNSDITFSGREHAKRIFKALFHAPNIDGIFKQGEGVSSSYSLFGQKFLVMDGRYFRQPPGTQNEPYGHLGKKQHEWLIAELKHDTAPTWLIMGDQFFMNLVEVEDKGKKKVVNETFFGDHPVNFENFLKDVKQNAAPVVFVSGDVHFSEISAVPASYLGYSTYEITASPYHSYIFGGKSWENPNRIVDYKEHNFVFIEAEVTDLKLKAKVRAVGSNAMTLFEKDIEVSKP